MKIYLSITAGIILIALSYFFVNQNTAPPGTEHNKTDPKVTTAAKPSDKSKRTINVRRINTQLINAENNDRDEALKEFLIAKGIFDGTRPIDISAIKTLTFEDLTNAELITVSYIPNLIELNISGTSVTNIDYLANMPNLKHLNISNTQIENIETLKDLRLKTLILKNSGVSDLNSIENLKTLEYLDISQCKIDDISSLKLLDHLVHLDISNTKVTNLSPILNLPKLKKLIYSNSAVVMNSENAELILRTR